MFIKEKNLTKTVIKKNSTIRDAIKSLNNSGLQICLVLDDNNNYLGTITDGDIRRRLIKGYNLESSVAQIINKKSIISKKKISISNAENILKKFDISHLPLVNNKKICGLYFKGNDKDGKKNLKNKVIIMAGGFGSRLGKLTTKTPKGMLKLNGKPLLEHIVQKLKKEGFKDILISVYYLKNQIKKYFFDGNNLGLNIKYLEEKYPMGTIGSLSLINKKLNDNLFVINCDVITDLNFHEMLKFHKKNNAQITLAVKSYQISNPYGVVNSKKNKFINFQENLNINLSINAGIYILKPELIKYIVKYKIKHIPQLINLVKFKKKILTYPMHENWEDYGSNSKELKN